MRNVRCMAPYLFVLMNVKLFLADNPLKIICTGHSNLLIQTIYEFNKLPYIDSKTSKWSDIHFIEEQMVSPNPSHQQQIQQ